MGETQVMYTSDTGHDFVLLVETVLVLSIYTVDRVETNKQRLNVPCCIMFWAQTHPLGNLALLMQPTFYSTTIICHLPQVENPMEMLNIKNVLNYKLSITKCLMHTDINVPRNRGIHFYESRDKCCCIILP